ncbi:MAG: GtrA family protein [Clostridia bacterium]|nr:GtrA family protein [Clostridia bacterium]
MERLARIVLSAILKPFHVTLSEKQWAGLMQFMRFAVIGVFNTAINLAFSYVTLFITDRAGWDGTIGSVGGFDRHLATLMGFLASCVNSYLFNSRYTFDAGGKKTAGEHLRAFVKVLISYSFANLLLGWALNVLWGYVGMNRYLGLLLNVLISIPINFVMNKFWAYKK